MKIKLLLVLLFLAQICHAQTIEGIWKGDLDTGGTILPVILNIKKTNTGYISSLNSPKQGTKDIAIDKTEFINNELTFEVKSIKAIYKGIFKKDHFEGNLIQNGASLPLNFTNKPTTADSAEKTTDIPYLKDHAIDTKKMDDFLDYIAKNKQGIGSVSIFRKGQEVYKKSFGQDQIKNSSYDELTKYQIGSISKLMTAVMIFQLIENNKLSLSDKLSKFYPEIPNAAKITIGNMMNHTSGLGDYVGKSLENNWLFGKPVGNDAIISAIKKDGVSFQPGEKTQYSNSGYFLLSRILEKIKNQPYHVILKENILDKAKMNNTFSVLDNAGNTFKSYQYKNNSWSEVKDFNFNNCIGLGDITSTPTDMNMFINALFSNQLIKKETLEIMMPQKDEKHFGRGIMKFPFYNITYFGHGGDTAGTHSSLSFEPVDQLSFAVTINGENLPHNKLYIDILRIMYHQDFEFPVFNETKIPASELEKYLGDYSSKDIPLALKIISKDGKLFAQGSGQPPFPLEYIEKDQFKFDDAGIKIIFDSEKHQLQLLQGGKTYVFNKK